MIPLDRILLSSLLVFTAQVATAADGRKIFNQGGENPAAMACMSCHGPDGLGLAAAGPSLAKAPDAVFERDEPAQANMALTKEGAVWRVSRSWSPWRRHSSHSVRLWCST